MNKGEVNKMKRVFGTMNVRPLGAYKFEFFVNDNATAEEIADKVDEICEYSINYHVEEGYIAEQKIVYRKKNPWE